MTVTDTPLPGVKVVHPVVHRDDRGFFLETYHARRYAEGGIEPVFVQDNHSRSARGVLRGLHYQHGDAAQGKLVRVVQGAVFDVAVDIRVGSPTFGRWVGMELSEANRRQLWIAPGLAHGFVVTSESADFLYKTTTYYAPATERAVRWDDPTLAVAWPDVGTAPIVSPKDAAAPDLQAVLRLS